MAGTQASHVGKYIGDVMDKAKIIRTLAKGWLAEKRFNTLTILRLSRISKTLRMPNAQFC